ncbi:adrenodoxin-type ferredoxin [Cryptococcus gattii Ru294]|nr:adrenodoxin-type ferredoxin [Cryptococcus gattii Ru294]
MSKISTFTRQLTSLATKINRPVPQRALHIPSLKPSPASSSLKASNWRSSILTSQFGQKRALHSSLPRWHGDLVRPEPGTGIKLIFRDSHGNDVKTVEGNEGDDILSLAHEHDIDLEGACEGSVACSTCHVIIDPEHFDMLPEADDEENDMLDLAFGLEDTSRLGCQVKLTKELDGMVATLPSATRNMYVDGKSSLVICDSFR